MINLIILTTTLNFSCYLNHLKTASSMEITKQNKILKAKPANIKHLTFLLKKTWNNGKPNSTILALSWLESRLRPFVKRGDKGQACGTFQIHARHSYPMFRRKSGYKNWLPKAPKNAMFINKECRRLESLQYSINTLNKYLRIFKKHKKHPCHHNSGIYGKCNTWYKKRLDMWITYFEVSKLICSTQ